jgi:methylenetetrahydrofolate dehydrogenase (NADP+)/methenyltetrahydrofolate cyclohydrolase
VHPEVGEVAGALTPVPGGVGPLTITMLMMNTLRAARERVGAPLTPPCLPERLGGVPQ